MSPILLFVLLCGETGADRLEWKEEWPRFQTQEMALTLGFGAFATGLTFLIPDPPTGFLGENGLDDSFRSGLRVTTETADDVVTLTSDILQNSAILYPFLVDIGLVTLLLDRNTDVGLELGLMAVEAFVLEVALIHGLKRTVGRARPSLEPCEGTDDDYSCRSKSQRRAMPSGHAAAAYTAAGLVCVQHQYLSLYGSPWDGLICGSMIAVATAAGLLRVAADEHHITDVIASSAIGFAAGYLLPYLVHFRRPAPDDTRLNGMLHMGAAAGPAASNGELEGAFGLVLSGRQQWWWTDDFGLGLEAGGVLVGTENRYFFRELRGGLRLWGLGMAIGPEISFRAEDRPERTALIAGGTVAFGIMEQGTTVVVSGSWLPLADGHADTVDGTLEVGLYRYLTFTMRVRTVDDGALFLLSAGGRLPW